MVNINTHGSTRKLTFSGYLIPMISIIPTINILCIFFAVIFTASAAQAQAIYQAQASETITASSPNGNQTVTVVLPRRAIQPAPKNGWRLWAAASSAEIVSEDRSRCRADSSSFGSIANTCKMTA